MAIRLHSNRRSALEDKPHWSRVEGRDKAHVFWINWAGWGYASALSLCGTSGADPEDLIEDGVDDHCATCQKLVERKGAVG